MRVQYIQPAQERKILEVFGDAVTIGRRAGPGHFVDLDLGADYTVSHRHARLSYADGAYWVEDLGSRNGTQLNDQPIPANIKMQLRPGDKVRIGYTVIEVDMEAPPQPQPVATPPTPPTPPPSAPPPTPEPEVEAGSVSNVAVAATPIFTAEAQADAPTDDAFFRAQRHLKAIYEFGQTINAQENVEILLGIVVETLRQALPFAQRGAVLLPDEHGQLLLKAHWPKGAPSVSATLLQRAFEQQEAFIWQTHETDPGQALSLLYHGVKAAIYVPLLCNQETLGVIYVDNFHTRDAFHPSDLDLVRAIASQIAMFISHRGLRRDLQQAETLRANLLRQFPAQVAERMLEEFNRLRMGGERADPVTILISDVRGFTSLSAKMQPADVVRMLNEMFDAFVPIIYEYDGIVDKYVGDAVLAVFGSPQKDTQQCEKAVKAALAMQEALHKLGEGWKVRRMPVFEVGIGIHSGEVIHGFIGAAERTEYTVIGDTVNRASRYCDGAGRGEVLISPAVYERVYRLIEVEQKLVKTKHPETEPDMIGYVVTQFRGKEASSIG